MSKPIKSSARKLIYTMMCKFKAKQEERASAFREKERYFHEIMAATERMRDKLDDSSLNELNDITKAVKSLQQLEENSQLKTEIQFVQEISAMTDVGTATIKRIKKEGQSNEGVWNTPGKKRPHKPTVANLDSFDINAVRQKINQFYTVKKQDGDKMSFQANSQMTKNFQKIHTIGNGGFGTVVKVKHKIDNGFYAIKCILLNLMDTQSNIMKEVKLLSQLSHDNIVRYYGAWTDDCNVDEARADDEETEGFSETRSFNRNSSSDIVFQDESDVSADPPSKSGSTQVLCIQMEFCKTTLADAIDNSNLYKKHFRAWKIFWEILQGLAYLKKKGIIHRDLKPENIFLDAEDRVKIGDFGLATQICRRSCTKEQFTNSLSAEVGTYFYRAPELNLIPEGSRAKYGQEVDMYSLGIILFEMFHPPFSTGSERYQVLTNLRKKEITMPKEFVEDEKNAELIPWIRLLLNHNANARRRCIDLLSMKKPKQLTNNRKSFQKQMKRKENITHQCRFIMFSKNICMLPRAWDPVVHLIKGHARHKTGNLGPRTV